MNLNAWKAEAAAKLPANYEPLMLMFYGLETKLRRGLLVIGDDYGGELCLNPASGVIQSIDPNGELLTRFMNSSIPQLAEFIRIHKRLVAEADFNDSTDLRPQLKLLRESFFTVDPAALAGPEHWWSTILEQLEFDL